MITIVGIRHTQNFEKQLKKLIYDSYPHAICVELDNFRYRYLKNQLSDDEIRTYFSSLPKIYKWLSLFKQKSQKGSGVDREWDAKTIFSIAGETKADVIPIDADQSSIYWEIEKNIPLSEKIRIFLSVMKEFLPHRNMESNEKDLKGKFSKNFPTLKRYLIDKRNEFMSQEIRKCFTKYESLMVVVGNAHVEGISRLIKDLKPKVVDVETLNKS
jgi:pheromone shutdown protein TraB